MRKNAQDVLDFWFVRHGQKDWFGGKPDFDLAVKTGFAETHSALAAGEGWDWRSTPHGRLAEIIVLDQFSRQLFRGAAAAFASDGMALVLAQELVASGQDKALTDQQRVFALMPYMHSESLAVHDEAVRLFTALDDADTLGFETKHKEVIERFGRFPKRNAALGRVSTPEEEAYIAEIGDRVF